MKRTIVALALIIISSSAIAQHWTNVTPLSSKYLPTPYFLNSEIGFSFFRDLNEANVLFFNAFSLPQLTRTTDGGTSWTPLRFFDSANYSITQLCFVSPQHGYAATVDLTDQVHGGIFETFDQGDHWKLISKDGLPCIGVYAIGSTIFAAEAIISDPFQTFVGGSISFSRDDGATWNSITNVPGLTLDPNPLFQFLYGNRDSLAATVYYHPVGYASSGRRTYDTYLVFSTDLGQSWQVRALDRSTEWAVTTLHITPHSCDIIREFVNFQDQMEDKYSFLKSSLDYRIWNPSFEHYEAGGWIAGNPCALYLSNSGFDVFGTPLYRSTDGGTSWIGLPGASSNQPDCTEIDDQDRQNISVVGHGAVVYVGDMRLSLWKTTDGGDGTLSESALAPQITITHVPFASGSDTLDANLCSSSSLVLSYQNVGCSYAAFQSVTVDGLDSSEYTQTSTHHRSCEWTPDTTFITIYPKTAGVRDLTIHSQFVDDEYNIIDSMTNVMLNVKPGTGTSVGLNIYVKPTPILVASGDTIDIPVYLNGDADQPVALSGTTTTHFTLTYDPISVLPLGFMPIMAGLTETGPITIANGSVSIGLQSPTGLTLTSETLIGTLRCVVYLSDTLRTSVVLANASIASNDPRCLALSSASDAVQIDITGCGDSTLLRYMKDGTLPFSIERISPNPANDLIDVQLRNTVHQALNYELDNALGARRSRGTITSDRFTLDTHDLANGIYYLRVMAAASSTRPSSTMRSIPDTRTIVIEH